MLNHYTTHLSLYCKQGNWRVRKLKSILGYVVIIIFSCTLLLWLYLDKVALTIAQKYTKPQLAPLELRIDCLDWTFEQIQQLKLNRVCLSHPLATIHLNQITLDDLKQPQQIDIANTQIDLLKPLLTLIPPTKSQTNQTLEQQIKNLFTQLNKLKQIKIPYHVHLTQLAITLQQKPLVLTQLKLEPHKIKLNLTQPLPLNFEQTDSGFTAQLTVNTNTLHKQLKQYQLPIPQWVEQYPINTVINANIQYDQHQLIIDHKIKPFDFQGLPQISTVFQQEENIEGSITLSPQQITWQNSDQPLVITIKTQKPFTEQLTQSLSPELQQIIADNPLEQIEISVPANSKIVYQNDQLTLKKLIINSGENNLQLESIALNPITQAINAAVIVKGQLRLPQLNQYTQQPIKLTADGQIKWQDNTLTTQLKLDTQLNQVTFKSKSTQARFEQIDIKAEQQGQLFPLENTPLAITATVQLDQLQVAQIQLTGDPQKPELQINATQLAITDLANLNISKPIDFKPISGQIDYQLRGQIQGGISALSQWQQHNFDLTFALEDFSGEVNNLWIQQTNFNHQFQLNQGILTSSDPNNKQTNLTIALIEVGTPISNLTAQLQLELNLIQSAFSLKVNNVNAQAFDGKFNIDKFIWPPKPSSQFNLTLDNLDLEKIVALEKKQGIEVTGRISGGFPTTLTQDDQSIQVTIDDGEIHNTTDGVLKVKDSPAVQRLKQSRDDLKLAFDALQNLQYHKLDAIVTMTPDGQMYLQTVIKGRNPDLDNEVNFNLGLDYDLIGLLQSMLISQRLEEQIKQKVQQNQLPN